MKQDKLKLKVKMSTDNVHANDFRFEQKEYYHVSLKSENWKSILDWTLLDVCFVKQDKLKLKGKMSTDNVDADGFKFEQKENCLLNDDYSLPFDTHCGN